MAIDLTIDGLDEPMAPDVALTAYRIVQEGVTNVARHADARQAHVRIWREASTLHIQISDHGRGFDAMATLATSASGGFLGMRERTAALGGSLHIESTPGNGTTITATLPLARPAT
jgi:signal transduction histidine kinase